MLFRFVADAGKQTDRAVVICEGKDLADAQGGHEDHLKHDQ